MFKILSKLFKKKWGLILLLAVILIAQCYLQLLLPTYMGYITQHLTTNAVTVDTNYILTIGGYMIGIAAAVFVLAITQNYMASYFAAYTANYLRRDVFEKVNSLSLGEYNIFGTATLITRTTNDIEQIRNFVLMGLKTMIMSPTFIIIALINILSLEHFQLIYVLACTVPLLIIILLILFKVASPLFRQLQTKLDNVTVVLRESLTGIRVVRAYNQQEGEYKKFDHANTDSKNIIKKVARTMSILNPSVNILFNSSYILIYLVGLVLVSGSVAGTSTMQILTDVSVATQYSTQIMQSFMMFAMVFIMWPQASACSKRIKEVLDLETSINDDEARKFAVKMIKEEYCEKIRIFSENYTKETGQQFNKDYLLDLAKSKHPKDEKSLGFARDFEKLYTEFENKKSILMDEKSKEYIELINSYFSKRNIRGELEFNNVTFTYPDADKPCIENVSFVAKPGTTTAIIGSTGSGKSTIVNLIPRFYDVSNGCIKLDGVDIRKLPQQTLRDNLGFVPQQAVLFYGTIKDNLKFGKPDATEQEIEEALTIAQTNHFISKLPDKTDTFVSQSGKNFSGGQKQRISIARALIKKPEIYVFDDSFSALDFKTDLALRSALKPYTANSAVIVVAQRVSTIINANNILVLNEGKVVDQGTHEELLVRCKVYQDIVKSQLDPDEVEKTIQLSKDKSFYEGGNK